MVEEIVEQKTEKIESKAKKEAPVKAETPVKTESQPKVEVQPKTEAQPKTEVHSKPEVQPKTETHPGKIEHREYRPKTEGRRYESRRFNKDYVPREHVHEKKVEVKKKIMFPEQKLFNKWSYTEVVVKDLGLAKYINLTPVSLPHTFGRNSQGRFAKADINIIERLINKMMKSGQGKRKMSGKFVRGRHGCGKKLQAIEITEKAFDIINKKTGQNPIQVLVKALEYAAPREDITRIKRGGVAYSVAVDVSPMKRLDESIKNIVLAGFTNSFNSKLSAEEALAEEIINSANNDPKGASVKRRDEVERIARASR